MQILTERYLNLFPGDRAREQYKGEVWDILQKVYEPIGGIKGSGFESPDDMVRRLPMWKLARKNGRIVAVMLYKDKGGRKVVASGSDGSPEGKAALADMAPQEPKRSYGEKSKAALGFFLKTAKNARDQLKTFEEAEKIIGKPIISVRDQWPPLDDEELEATQESLKRYPFLRDYGYFREIGGEWHFKVMFGTTGLTITPP